MITFTPLQLEAGMPSLSDKSRDLIEATLPVVGEHIEEIADHFPRHLFTSIQMARRL